ncbi:MAG: ankyrin [Pseudomonadota bacterium]
MPEKSKKICPTCNGKKVVDGTCECNAEWRGTQNGDTVDDCQCSPETKCPTCSGTGFVNA